MEDFPSLLQNTKTYRLKQCWIFILTFFAYSSFHITRKTFSNVKYSMHADWGMTTIFMGTLDTIFLLTYSVGLYVSGHIGDRFPLRAVLSIGMISTGIFVALFGLARVWNIHSQLYFGIVWGLCGLVQSTGWPSAVTIMGKWFPNKRGVIFGVWSANISTGNALGSVISSALLAYGLNWAFAFFVPAAIITFLGIIVLLLLIPHPDEVQVASSDAYSSTDSFSGNTPDNIINNIINDGAAFTHKYKVNFFRAWFIPGVAVYAIANAFIKLVNYAFFFWLPYYLTQAIHEQEDIADLLSSVYDVGGIIGGLVFGIASDVFVRHHGGRTLVILPMLILSAASFYLYRFEGGGSRTVNSLLMLLCGIFVNGAYNLISSAVSADLGTTLRGDPAAISTVVGIIDGTGSIGAAAGQVLVAWISLAWGWNATFYMLIASSLLSALCLAYLFFKELLIFITHLKG